MKNNNSRLQNLMDKGNYYYRNICFYVLFLIISIYHAFIIIKGVALQNLNELELLLDPNLKQDLNNEGRAYLDIKEYQKAIDCFDKALEIDPKQIYPLYNKGSAYHDLDEYQKAIDCFDKVLIIDPKHIYTLYYQGSAYNDLKQYQKAIDCYDKILKIDPKHILSLNMKGSALNELEQFNEAIKYFDQAILIDKDDQIPYKNKGFSYLQLKQYDKALNCYNQALRIDPQYIEIIEYKRLVMEFIKQQDKLDQPIYLNENSKSIIQQQDLLHQIKKMIDSNKDKKNIITIKDKEHLQQIDDQNVKNHQLKNLQVIYQKEYDKLTIQKKNFKNSKQQSALKAYFPDNLDELNNFITQNVMSKNIFPQYKPQYKKQKK